MFFGIRVNVVFPTSISLIYNEPMHKKPLFIAAVAVLLSTVAAASFVLPDALAQQKQSSSAALTVDTAKARMESWPDIIQASGPIAAWQEAIIGAEISGQRLTELLVDVGDVVKKGQLLARFNPDTVRAEEAELKAAYIQASADRKRAMTLKGTGAMSVQQADSLIAQAAIAKARLDVKTLQLRYTEVLAPDDGIISSRTATLGAVGTTGQELFRMIRQNRLEWRGELTASQLAAVEIGQLVDVTLPDGSKAEATIRQISPSLDTQSRMATVFADLKPDSAARAGMYGDARIKRASRQGLVVPSKSVVIRDGYSYVFTLSADKDGTQKAIQQKIIPGREQGGLTEIVGGLSEGSVVAVQGAGFLNDGDIVRIAPDKVEPAKSPSS